MQQKIIHVLLLEDEAAHAELIELALEDRDDIHLQVVSNLEDARQALSAASPDVAIVDSLLPDGDGVELLRQAKSESGFPVILMTSHADATRQAEALAAGATRYLVKSESTLLDMPQIIDSVVGRRDS